MSVIGLVDTTTGAKVAPLRLDDLGSMATQNSNSVAVTGGTIDGASLGATTLGVTAASGTNSTHLATTAFSNAASIKYAIVFG